MKRMAKKIALVVDDDTAIRESVIGSLKQAGFTPLSAHSVLAANRIICELRPEIILLDWLSRGQSSLSFAKELRENYRTRHVPIIMLSSRDDETDVIAALDAGADDYIIKPFSPRELVARIRSILRRRAPELTDDLAVVGPISLDPVYRSVTVTISNIESQLELAPTEFRLLHYLMAHPERIHSRAQILDKVWGDHVSVGERVVDVYIKHLRACLTRANLPEIIQTVRGAGYRLTASS